MIFFGFTRLKSLFKKKIMSTERNIMSPQNSIYTFIPKKNKSKKKFLFFFCEKNKITIKLQIELQIHFLYSSIYIFTYQFLANNNFSFE